MKILAFDTSDRVVSVVLSKNGQLLSRVRAVGIKNYESIMSLIDALMKKARLSMSEINLLGACVGPGSFTGIRIGLSTAKALSYACAIPVVGYKSLDVDAWMFKDHVTGYLCVMRDARRNNVYAALYEHKAKTMRRKSPYFLGTLDALLDSVEIFLKKEGRGRGEKSDMYFYGDVVENCCTRIKEKFSFARMLSFRDHRRRSRAMISFVAHDRSRAVDCFGLKPLYMYPKDCQVQKKKGSV